VSAIIDILRSQERKPGSEPEDVWLAERLGHRPGSKLANGTVSLTFSGEMYSGKGAKVVEEPQQRPGKGGKNMTLLESAKSGQLVKGLDDWRSGFYEPMGYHTGASGATTHGPIWGTPEKRKHIWDYCPEVKMTLMMDAAKYVPGACGATWKRNLLGGGADGEQQLDVRSVDDVGYGTEVINGKEYPLLPPNLRPW